MTETATKGFSSNFGTIMAAAGSAIGLGNIWRFPYITGKYGGGAFIVVYILFVVFIGMVLMMSEFIVGRRSQHTPMQAYTSLQPQRKGWKWFGLFCMFTCFMILSLYWVVSGWTTNYVYDTVTGRLSTLNNSQVGEYFNNFVASPFKPIIFIVVFAVITGVVVKCGVQKGVEAASKFLMPMLLLLVLVLCVRSLTLPGAKAGLDYLFHPDFSKLTAEGVLAALGQALFSLSVGMGAMVVYGSYTAKDDHLLKNSMWIAGCDTAIAILAGVAIFPAVFSCGLEPAGGPGLVFKVLPNVFNNFGGIFGILFGTFFFLLLAIAALTSAISLLESLTAARMETHHTPRTRAISVFLLLSLVLAAVCSLSNGLLNGIRICGKSIFDFVDSVNSIYLPPLCAIGCAVFVGWVMPKVDVQDELSNHGTLRISWFRFYYFLIKFVAPVALVVVLVAGIITG